MDLEQVLHRYHDTLSAFGKGDPEPLKAIWSHADDVILANPFGPAVRGWARACEALDYASSRLHDGGLSDADRLATYAGDDLASVVEIEHWHSRVGERADVEEFELRVTTTFRREDGAWAIVHRHADPIATPDPDGPLRGSSASA